MKTIYKYLLSLNGTFLYLPEKYEILSIQKQNGEFCVWAMIEEGTANKQVRINVFGTDWGLPENPGEYISTVQDGPLVWHFFKEEV